MGLLTTTVTGITIETMPNPKDILARAIKRIEDPARWTQHAWARDKGNQSVEITSARACSWCASAAIYVEADSLNEAHEAMRLVNEANPDAEGGITHINDTFGHERVLAMLRKAL